MVVEARALENAAAFLNMICSFETMVSVVLLASVTNTWGQKITQWFLQIVIAPYVHPHVWSRYWYCGKLRLLKAALTNSQC